MTIALIGALAGAAFAFQQPEAPPRVSPLPGRHIGWIKKCETVNVAAGADRSAKFDLFTTELVERCSQPMPAMRCSGGFGPTIRRPGQQLVLPAPAPSALTVEVCLNGDDVSVKGDRWTVSPGPENTLRLTPK